MGTTQWDPVVIMDVVNQLTVASNNIETELAGVTNDVVTNLDYANWHDDARPIYDEQQKKWDDAAKGMYTVLGNAIPTLTNMHDNLGMTEHTNKLTFGSIY
jgi:uncharacterized protein YukE